MNRKLVMMSAIAAALAVGAPTHAAVVGDGSPFAVVEDFEGFDGLVSQGPVALGGGVVASSSIDATFGAVAVDLGDNGNWGAGNNFAGIGDLSFIPGSFDFDGSLTFGWTQGRTGAGALFSVYQDIGGTAEILLEALSFNGSVLESANVLINFADASLYNAGSFYGFLRNTNDVYGLRISGDGFVLDNLSLAPVPLPAALPLLLGGLAMLGGAARRRRPA